MKRLVLLGEGHGERGALPLLAKKILLEQNESALFVDEDIVRARNALGLLKWNKHTNQTVYEEWLRYVKIAAIRKNLGGILAVFDGDAKKFPAGSDSQFCAATAAKQMAQIAKEAGAGKIFSLAIVFACTEYESWVVAGAESLAGKLLRDGRYALPPQTKFPPGDSEAHGKRWLENNCPGYRPARDQKALTELLDIKVVREKKLRSFRRLENAMRQLSEASRTGSFISTPA